MTKTTLEQIKQVIADKQNILLVFDRQGQEDAIGAVCALAAWLRKLDKRVDMVASGFELPKRFDFIVGAEQIRPQLGHVQQYILTVDVADTGIKELSYDIKDNKLRIFLTPQQGMIQKSAIRSATSDYLYDLIIVLNTGELDLLGEFYHKNIDFFNQTPIVNIDHHAANEHFGHINWVDLTASTTSEMIFRLMKGWHAEYIDGEIATALLAGMIAGTNSFKHENVKPHTLSLASKLVELGADRSRIIKHLYRTKSVATCKLWGAALSHLEQYKDIHTVASTITREDFVRSGAKHDELYAIIDELISTAPEAKIILLLHEKVEPANEQPQIHGIIQTLAPYQATAIGAPFAATGDDRKASFVTKSAVPLQEVKETLTDHIRTLGKI